MSEQGGRYQRSVGGMVGAMLVLVVVILVWIGFRALTSSEPSTPVQQVDYAREVPVARAAADFDLLAPASLPRGWRATTVGFTGGPEQHWHLGVLTDQGRYVGLEQGTGPVRAMVQAYVDEAAVRGRDVEVAGRPWASYSDQGGDLALVRRAGGTTTLVVGHEVPAATLAGYTGSLR